MNEPHLYSRVESPIGELLLVGDGHALHGLHMQAGRTAISVDPHWRRADAPFAEVRAQLSEYFAGGRRDFDVPLATAGTPFQRRVWDALQEIPYGETATYGALAQRLARPSASRAVGFANGRNPIAVIVPCHRVIGSDGSLTGYGGGLERKSFLLGLEAARAARWVRRSPATAATAPGS
jgi:methylated-DNA-[protein]-cysteine S-methyltransferase